MPTRRARLASALLLLGPLSCDSADDTVKAGEQAAREASQQALDASKKKAGELADEAADASKKAAGELADKSKQAASDLADATKSGAKALFHDLTNDGELSQTAKSWLEGQASGADSVLTIETVLVNGVQLAPVALEAAKVLADATDSETVVEPIFQKVHDDPAAIDQAIGDMPRVQVVDDVTVGFKQIDGLSGTTQVKERGYLVMWRHEDHLVGFVYRSTRTIDLEKLVTETPRLIRLTQKALED
ncbi:hypothetical protein [Paraliomyxa miuraensis]|uniref:hypothetical protein n=1 Tax=Paraliomyxa miuraensis TaxID=376150 RepID=UPI00225517D8|nr:hypothetical protein [Paraliomyxa miuraensis]MCX4241542.1 hypothetical protein [Paraliomyxa miuraensis]